MQMAEYYISLLPSSLDLSTIILGGWSFGGVVAFEAARQILEKRGVRVKGLILIDSPYPIEHKPIPQEVISHILQPTTVKKNHDLEFNDMLVEEFRHNAALLGSYTPTALTGSKTFGIPTVMLQSQDTFNAEAHCGVKYPWLESQTARGEAIVLWEGLIGDEIKVMSIPGNHFEAFSPKVVEDTLQRISDACRFIEAR